MNTFIDKMIQYHVLNISRMLVIYLCIASERTRKKRQTTKLHFKDQWKQTMCMTFDTYTFFSLFFCRTHFVGQLFTNVRLVAMNKQTFIAFDTVPFFGRRYHWFWFQKRSKLNNYVVLCDFFPPVQDNSRWLFSTGFSVKNHKINGFLVFIQTFMKNAIFYERFKEHFSKFVMNNSIGMQRKHFFYSKWIETSILLFRFNEVSSAALKSIFFIADRLNFVGRTKMSVFLLGFHKICSIFHKNEWKKQIYRLALVQNLVLSDNKTRTQ